jgi:hypothetical protein
MKWMLGLLFFVPTLAFAQPNASTAELCVQLCGSVPGASGANRRSDRCGIAMESPRSVEQRGDGANAAHAGDRAALRHNTAAGTRYVTKLMWEFHGDLRLVAAAYYALCRRPLGRTEATQLPQPRCCHLTSRRFVGNT